MMLRVERGFTFSGFPNISSLCLFLGTAQREKSGQLPLSYRQFGAIRSCESPLRRKAGRSQISRCGDALWWQGGSWGPAAGRRAILELGSTGLQHFTLLVALGTHRGGCQWPAGSLC